MPDLPRFANLRDGYQPEEDSPASGVIVWVVFAAACVLLTAALIALDPLGLL